MPSAKARLEDAFQDIRQDRQDGFPARFRRDAAREGLGRPDLARELLRSGRSEAGEAWKTPDSCPQCRECEEKCTQRLDIMEALGKVMGLLA
jgi:hypothetical protein